MILQQNLGSPGVAREKIPLATMEAVQLDSLFHALRVRGYQLIGPTRRDGVILYDEITSVADLPAGWTDLQEPGKYRLVPRQDRAFFGYNAGIQSWKRFLFPSSVRLWHASRNDTGVHVTEDTPPPSRKAFIGVRSCELHALAIQDRLLTGEMYSDPQYIARRDGLFILALNCGQAGGTCFCASTGTGPEATGGFDLSMTEVLDGNRHYFVVRTGSETGAHVLAEVPHREATDEEAERAARIVAETAHHMGRTLKTEGLKELLYANAESPQWEEISKRCLTCGNCTSVCPTCFCTSVEDVTDLTTNNAERWRRWDSCYTLGFSYIHGGSVRVTGKSRYRQWMTHKLAYWQDQFGTLGCVGCGRCITWCPAAIDITEEARRFQESAEPAVAVKEN